MFTIIENHPITGEDLAEMGDIGRCELVEGKIIKYDPNFWPHGNHVAQLGYILGSFVDQHHLGLVLVGEVGFYTRRNPDTVRGADVIFISNERLAQVKPVLSEAEGSASFLDVAPELVVEVMSPDDRWSEVKQKIREYFAAGVNLVWVADPADKTVSVYRALSEVSLLAETDTLNGEEILPGFSAAIAALFAD